MYQLQKEKNISMIFRFAITIGLIFSLLHLAHFIFDMSLSLLFYQKINVTSVAYLICHLFIIFIPLLLIMPYGNIPKAFILKWILYGISLCFLLGNTWIIYYLVSGHSFASIFTASLADLEAYQRENALMLNYMTWGCYSPINIIFSTIQSALFFIAARKLTKNSRKFALAVSLTLVLAVVVPICYIAFGASPVEDWMKNNIYLLATHLFIVLALVPISMTRTIWKQALWSIALKR